MDLHSTRHDAIVIGGGFYGAAVAIYLARQRHLKRIILLEREAKLMQRASFNNQARVHNGYHYPRSFVTAYRSRVNLPRFLQDWPQAVRTDFTKLYAIARRNSKVTASQFTRFCRDIGADIRPARPQFANLFEEHLVERVFEVQEYAFDSTQLADWAMQELTACGVQVCFGMRAEAILREQDADAGLRLMARDADGTSHSLAGHLIFNCTYSGLNQFGGGFEGTATRLKHEITEMALVKMPPSLEGLGVTMMDGPFFSFMPFPAEGLHTVSHVRYTPHLNWSDDKGIDPYQRLASYPKETRVDRMMRDIQRYVPSISEAAYRRSLFEVKTILVKNEGDDGRPILFERHAGLPGCYTILGGKIDNIYDVLEKLDSEPLVHPDIRLTTTS